MLPLQACLNILAALEAGFKPLHQLPSYPCLAPEAELLGQQPGQTRPEGNDLRDTGTEQKNRKGYGTP